MKFAAPRKSKVGFRSYGEALIRAQAVAQVEEVAVQLQGKAKILKGKTACPVCKKGTVQYRIEGTSRRIKCSTKGCLDCR